MRAWLILTACAATVAAGTGCGRSTKEKMIDLVPMATARDVYFGASGLASPTAAPADPTCPAASTVGTTTMLQGGCTDSEGAVWSGSAVFDGDVAGDWTASWTAFTRVAPPGECEGDPADDRGSVTVDGTASLTGTAGAVATFAMDVVQTEVSPNLLGCGEHTTEKIWDYEGTIETGADNDGDAVPDELTFDGTGAVTRNGDDGDLTLTATTVAQFMDRTICDQEPLSGTTTLVAGGHTGVVTNDGATDCDDPPTAAFSYDGAEQDEVAIGGVCTVVRLGGHGSPAALALLAGAALLAVALRRRSPGATGR